MTEEKGNTIQFTSDENMDFWLWWVTKSFNTLRDRFGYNVGRFKVTIEFYPDSEVEDE